MFKRRTNTGRVVYNRKHHPFDMTQALAIIQRMYSKSEMRVLDNYAQWRAIADHATRVMLYLEELKYAQAGSQLGPDQFELFLMAFDEFVKAVRPFGNVPGVGWLLEIVLDLYEYVRRLFYD